MTVQDSVSRELRVSQSLLVRYMKLFPRDLAVSDTGVQKKSAQTDYKPKGVMNALY
jgi:hypothetical protein